MLTRSRLLIGLKIKIPQLQYAIRICIYNQKYGTYCSKPVFSSKLEMEEQNSPIKMSIDSVAIYTSHTPTRDITY